jgi:NAD+ diphosphatase
LPSEPLQPLKRSLCLGTWQNKAVLAGEVDAEMEPPGGWVWHDMRELYGKFDEALYALAGQAVHLLQWDRAHAFCGLCGTKTLEHETERAKCCSSCGHLFYPKMSLVTMILICREKKILLARGPHFPEKMYSVLAGYVDPGETLEQSVLREVREEVGLEVKNIRYVASQPWPFSYSFITGFICDWHAGEILADPGEIEDAGWFDASGLPQIPSHLSLARTLIDLALTSTRPSIDDYL